MALAQRAVGKNIGTVALFGIISAGLFYGDAMITPALSVLSAVEGLKIATPAFDAYIVPLTVVILIALFAVQSRGTAKVAAFFGPITLVWFIAIAIAGLWHLATNWSVLATNVFEVDGDYAKIGATRIRGGSLRSYFESRPEPNSLLAARPPDRRNNHED